MRRRVVITGMGVITPLGDRPSELFDAQIAGRSGVGPITRFDASTFPTRFAAEVPNFDLGRYLADPSPWKDAGEASLFAAAASHRALADAGLLDLAGIDPSRFGVYLGTGEGTQDVEILLSLIARSYQRESHTLEPLAFARLGLSEYRAGKEYEQELHTP